MNSCDWLQSHSPFLVLGRNGQLANSLAGLIENQSGVTFWSRKDLDLEKPSQVAGALDKLNPKIIFNAAAYTKVDQAESEQELAHAINEHSVRELANWCRREKAKLVHFSTDYVYPGEGSRPWRETDEAKPKNAYGRSKLAGEIAIRESGCEHLIFRTSWVYSNTGKNFFLTMLRLAHEQEVLKVVDDQIGAPTLSDDLAEWSLGAVGTALEQSSFPSGIYNLCSAGHTSWRGFAESIIAAAKSQDSKIVTREVTGISTSAYPTPATRPLNSRLDLSSFQSVFNRSPRHWSKGLNQCIERFYESH